MTTYMQAIQELEETTDRILKPEVIHKYAVDKGWWDKDRPVPELLCLLHSEISEGLEAYRNNVPEGEKGCLSEELADVVIRIWDMSFALGIDIIKAVEKKHKENLERPYRHGNKRC
jgi:NTP pyrophosphatase (non-canonical NTP hydrolase)